MTFGKPGKGERVTLIKWRGRDGMYRGVQRDREGRFFATEIRKKKWVEREVSKEEARQRYDVLLAQKEAVEAAARKKRESAPIITRPCGVCKKVYSTHYLGRDDDPALFFCSKECAIVDKGRRRSHRRMIGKNLQKHLGDKNPAPREGPAFGVEQIYPGSFEGGKRR